MQVQQKLNNGKSIPVLGLGTWKSKSNEVGKAVEYAIIEAGYRHIDCASIYGNEKEIGLALKKVQGKIKREDLFITSKLWNTNHKKENVERSCRKTLKDLNLKYLDLYLMHWGIAFKHGEDLEPIGKDGKVILEKVSIQETWTAMEDLVKKGLVKSIGISNFTVPMMVDLLTYAKIKPVMNQIELHPYNSQKALVQFCKDNGIAVTAYSPLGRHGTINIEGIDLFEEPIVKRLAKKYQKSAPQILLNWAINRGTITIPKTTNPEKISENINIFDFELTKGEIEEISFLNKNQRLVDPSEWWGIPYFK